jgi:5-methylcytosine-specific restriction endonuclease McrA
MVFVLDKKKRPLMPCTEKRARLLLRRGRAVVHRLHPFTIRLKDRLLEESEIQPVVLKVDPGSKATGVALVREENTPEGPIHHLLHAAEIVHRGEVVRERMRKRAAFRRRRRSANLRYRVPRFDNRRKPEGWLPPSLRSRVGNILTWAMRYSRLAPVVRIDMELVKFDTQKLQNPEISGVEYQRGELFGYEVREYLLEKWGRRCAYCGAEEVPLEIEHIVPRSRGGTDRVSNLTLACRRCNQAKGNLTAEEFGHPEVQAKARKPLKDAAAVNTTRWALFRGLSAMGLEVRCWTGGRTKQNRERLGLPKAHAIDALCVGDVAGVSGAHSPVLLIKATGRGQRQRTNTDAAGFPRGYRLRRKTVHGFRTGDLVLAIVQEGKHTGIHAGRVVVRASGQFRVGARDKISWRWCRLLQRADGYEYGTGGSAPRSPVTHRRPDLFPPTLSTAPTRRIRPGATRHIIGKRPHSFFATPNGSCRDQGTVVDSNYHLCYRMGADGVGAAKTKPHSLKPPSDSNGLATLNGSTRSSRGNHACGDSSDGGTGMARSTSHGSVKQEATGRVFHTGGERHDYALQNGSLTPPRPLPHFFGTGRAPRLLPLGSTLPPYSSLTSGRPGALPTNALHWARRIMTPYSASVVTSFSDLGDGPGEVRWNRGGDVFLRAILDETLLDTAITDTATPISIIQTATDNTGGRHAVIPAPHYNIGGRLGRARYITGSPEATSLWLWRALPNLPPSYSPYFFLCVDESPRHRRRRAIGAPCNGVGGRRTRGDEHRVRIVLPRVTVCDHVVPRGGMADLIGPTRLLCWGSDACGDWGGTDVFWSACTRSMKQEETLDGATVQARLAQWWRETHARHQGFRSPERFAGPLWPESPHPHARITAPARSILQPSRRITPRQKLEETSTDRYPRTVVLRVEQCTCPYPTPTPAPVPTSKSNTRTSAYTHSPVYALPRLPVPTSPSPLFPSPTQAPGSGETRAPGLDRASAGVVTGPPSTFHNGGRDEETLECTRLVGTVRRPRSV